MTQDLPDLRFDWSCAKSKSDVIRGWTQYWSHFISCSSAHLAENLRNSSLKLWNKKKVKNAIMKRLHLNNLLCLVLVQNKNFSRFWETIVVYICNVKFSVFRYVSLIWFTNETLRKIKNQKLWYSKSQQVLQTKAFSSGLFFKKLSWKAYLDES